MTLQKATTTSIFLTFITIIVSNTLKAQEIPPPLLYLNFEGAQIEDQSANEQALTFHGTITANSNNADGAPNGATSSTGLQLTGGGVIKTPIAVQSQLESYTLSAWIRPTAASLSGDRFFWGQENQGIHNGLRQNGRLHEAHWGNDWYANTILSADQWVHAVFTYDGLQDNTDNTGTGRIYLNGTLDGEKIGNHGRPNNPSNLLIGGRQGQNGGGTGERHFEGTVDEMVVWDRVLTEAQITALADGVSPIAVSDEDEDSLPDWWENKYAGNLTSLSGLAGDFDEDGLTDYDEFETGTNPTEEDTDEDGLGDAVESNTGTFVSESDTGTDPLSEDTDSDGLNDGAEIFTHETNPHIFDSDGDGFSDGTEINSDSDPNDEDSMPELVTTVDLSFPPSIGGPGAGQNAYQPNLEESGLSFQENHYGAGVLINNNTDQNYDRVVINPENWTPARSKTQVEPYFDHGNGGFTTPSGGNRPWIDGGGDDFSVRINGYMLLKQIGTYTIHLGGDDTNYFVIDTPDGAVNVKHNCCPQDTQGTFTVTTPGYYPFDNLFCERGGGDWGDVSITGPGIPQRVALGDVAAGSPPIYTIMFNPADTDNDLLPDWWEITYADSLDTLSGLDDSDLDGDTLTDFDEYENGTNPSKKDTDGDGLEDNIETNSGIFVSASDTGTDPTKADTDGDGLNDNVETNTGVLVGATDTGTNPTAKDSDSDGFSDSEEINESSNPFDPNDIPPPLLLYFDFEGDAASTVTDKSDAAHNGIFSGNVTFSNEGAPAGPSPGGSASFTGGFINVFDLQMNPEIRDFGTGSYTMTCWLKPSDILDEKFVFGQTQQGIHNGIRNNSFLHQAHWGADTNGSTQLAPYIASDSDGWIHVAFVYDGAADQGTIYLDGQQDWTGAKRAPNGGGNFIIGGRNNGERPYQGLIDEVAVWRITLTAEEILALAEGGSPMGGSQPPIQITNVSANFSDESPVVTMSFNSKAGKIYAVDRTTDFLLWEELDDGLEGEADSTQFVDSFVPPNARRIFYRVRQVE